MYANIFCDAGQVPISRYFEAWVTVEFLKAEIIIGLTEAKPMHYETYYRSHV